MSNVLDSPVCHALVGLQAGVAIGVAAPVIFHVTWLRSPRSKALPKKLMPTLP